MLGILHALKGDLQFGPRVSGQGIQVCDIRGADARRFPGKEDGGKGVGHRRSLPPGLYAKIHGERFGGGPSLRFAVDFKRERGRSIRLHTTSSPTPKDLPRVSGFNRRIPLQASAAT